MSEVKPR
ncbi:hypothetical protein OYC64_017051, partial [Pagothenia borchgrevinki]